MGNPPHDTFHCHGSDDDKDRVELDRIFKAGVEARGSGRSAHDNPYAAGSEERDEWAAGWNATPELDADEDLGGPL